MLTSVFLSLKKVIDSSGVQSFWMEVNEKINFWNMATASLYSGQAARQTVCLLKTFWMVLDGKAKL
jgi:hypothetical protein